MFPRLPPIYRGSRLLMCVMLLIGVAAFFLAYDHIAHPGMPAFSGSIKTATIVPRPFASPGHTRFDETPTPDMNSSEVKFASADVLPSKDIFYPSAVAPRKSQIKVTVEPKQQKRVLKVQRQKANPARVARIKVRSQGRAAYAESYSPGVGTFRQF